MNCRNVKNKLSPHLDGRLPSAVVLQVDAHLEECPHCRAEQDELRALKALLAGAPPPQAPPGLWDAVHAGLREHVERQPARPAPGWLGWVWGRAPMVTAGLAMLLLAAILPIRYLEQSPAQNGVTIDELVARHAGYCARQPLLEHGSLHYLVAEAGVDGAE
jgi:anti-sigma factor RsiW